MLRLCQVELPFIWLPFWPLKVELRITEFLTHPSSSVLIVTLLECAPGRTWAALATAGHGWPRLAPGTDGSSRVFCNGFTLRKTTQDLWFCGTVSLKDQHDQPSAVTGAVRSHQRQLLHVAVKEMTWAMTWAVVSAVVSCPVLQITQELGRRALQLTLGGRELLENLLDIQNPADILLK